MTQTDFAAKHLKRLNRRIIHPADRQIIAIDADDNPFPPPRTVDIRLSGEHHRADVDLRLQRVSRLGRLGGAHLVHWAKRSWTLRGPGFNRHPVLDQCGELCRTPRG